MFIEVSQRRRQLLLSQVSLEQLTEPAVLVQLMFIEVSRRRRQLLLSLVSLKELKFLQPHSNGTTVIH
jgi:hypothetical protein